MRHTAVMKFDWKMDFVTDLLPVENGKILQKWPKMGFSTGIISSHDASMGPNPWTILHLLLFSIEYYI